MRKKILLALWFCLFYFLFQAGQARAQADLPPAPTLLAPNEQTITSDLTPVITGLTKNGTTVKIFIDGAEDGEANSLSHPSGTANFNYRPSLYLSRGWHKVYAVALGLDRAVSQPSNELNFRIEWPMPAPTMIKAVVNKNTVSAKPFIAGLAKNNSRIKVYIDQKYNGEFSVTNHQSGTANFAYKPAAALFRGGHQAYTVAVDSRGKASINSNVINFFVKTAVIAQAAREERKSAVAKINEASKERKKDGLDQAVISPSTGQVENQAVNKQTGQNQKSGGVAPAPLEKIKSLLGANAEQATSSSGLINEAKENQGKLRLSLALFILFLVGVVAWLLWVNRELIKERRAQNPDGKNGRPENNNPPDTGQENKLL